MPLWVHSDCMYHSAAHCQPHCLYHDALAGVVASRCTRIGRKVLHDMRTLTRRHKEPWAPYVVTDGLLVTGQNPQSTRATAEALLKLL